MDNENMAEEEVAGSLPGSPVEEDGAEDAADGAEGDDYGENENPHGSRKIPAYGSRPGLVPRVSGLAHAAAAARARVAALTGTAPRGLAAGLGLRPRLGSSGPGRGPSKMQLMVGNIPPQAQEQHIQAVFKQARIPVARLQMPQEANGVALVDILIPEHEDREVAADFAVHRLSGADIGGWTVQVEVKGPVEMPILPQTVPAASGSQGPGAPAQRPGFNPLAALSRLKEQAMANRAAAAASGSQAQGKGAVASRLAAAGPEAAGAAAEGQGAARYKTQLCTYWKENRCTKGEACAYAHGEEQLASNQQKTLTPAERLRKIAEMRGLKPPGMPQTPYGAQKGGKPTTVMPPAWSKGGQAADPWSKGGQAADSWEKGGQAADSWEKGGQAADSWGKGGQAADSWGKGGQAADAWGKGGHASDPWAKGGQGGDAWGKGGHSDDSWGKGGQAPVDQWGQPAGKEKMCSYFQEGRCQRGEGCHYAHHESELAGYEGQGNDGWGNDAWSQDDGWGNDGWGQNDGWSQDDAWSQPRNLAQEMRDRIAASKGKGGHHDPYADPYGKGCGKDKGADPYGKGKGKSSGKWDGKWGGKSRPKPRPDRKGRAPLLFEQEDSLPPTERIKAQVTENAKDHAWNPMMKARLNVADEGIQEEDKASPFLVNEDGVPYLFETYGLGAQLLVGMGWSPGAGVGKTLSGRIEPVSVQVMLETTTHFGRRDRRCLGVPAPAEFQDSERSDDSADAPPKEDAADSRNRKGEADRREGRGDRGRGDRGRDDRGDRGGRGGSRKRSRSRRRSKSHGRRRKVQPTRGRSPRRGGPRSRSNRRKPVDKDKKPEPKKEEKKPEVKKDTPAKKKSRSRSSSSSSRSSSSRSRARKKPTRNSGGARAFNKAGAGGASSAAGAQAGAAAAAPAAAAAEAPAGKEPPEIAQAKKQVLAKLTVLKNVEPKEQRMKEFRDMLRVWHPDKNPERIDMATAVFQFLQKGKSLLNLK